MMIEMRKKCWLCMGWERMILPALMILMCVQSPAVLATQEERDIDPDKQFELAQGHVRSGRFIEALQAWEVLRKYYQSQSNTQNLASVLVSKAEIYLSLGKLNQAQIVLHEAIELAGNAQDKELLAKANILLGSIYSEQGKYDAALASLESARGYAEKNQNTTLLAAVLNNQAGIYLGKGDITEAIRLYGESERLYRESGYVMDLATVVVNKAKAYMFNQDYKASRRSIDIALQMLETQQASHAKAYSLIACASVLQKVAEMVDEEDTKQIIETSRSVFNESIEIAGKLGDTLSLSYAYGYQSMLLASVGEMDAAINKMQRAKYYAQVTGASDPLYRWQAEEARLMKRLDRLEDAIDMYRQAIQTIQPVLVELKRKRLSEIKSGVPTDKDLYFEYADLLLMQSEKMEQGSQQQAYLAEARSTLESYKAGELEDYFKDDCVSVLESKTTGIDDLGEGAAALYPVLLPDRVSLLLGLPSGIKQYVVDISREEINREVVKFRGLLEKRTTFEYIKSSKRLYRLLISPIEEDLRANNIDTIVIVPDGSLRMIPLAALHDGKKYLIEKYSIATTPGLKLTDPRPIDRGQMEVLMSGLTEPVQGFNALPNVNEEVNFISSLFSGQTLMNEKFVSKNMKKELDSQPFTVVHIASHGQFSKDVKETFLLTYSDRLTMDLLEEFLAPSQFRDRPVELLTLSACQTAAGDEKAALGLAGVAIKSGARSALATLWFINDQASTTLVTGFYDQLKNHSIHKAEALRRAQLNMISDRRYRHAAYWSPFLIIGNWL